MNRTPSITVPPNAKLPTKVRSGIPPREVHQSQPITPLADCAAPLSGEGFLSGAQIIDTAAFLVKPITRLKMTLHNLSDLGSSGHSPLTRCTFGAVYSATPGEEDKVYGDATPYGSLSYNVRSELAAHLEVGEAYYVDIVKVPS